MTAPELHAQLGSMATAIEFMGDAILKVENSVTQLAAVVAQNNNVAGDFRISQSAATATLVTDVKNVKKTLVTMSEYNAEYKERCDADRDNHGKEIELIKQKQSRQSGQVSVVMPAIGVFAALIGGALARWEDLSEFLGKIIK